MGSDSAFTITMATTEAALITIEEPTEWDIMMGTGSNVRFKHFSKVFKVQSRELWLTHFILFFTGMLIGREKNKGNDHWSSIFWKIGKLSNTLYCSGGGAETTWSRNGSLSSRTYGHFWLASFSSSAPTRILPMMAPSSPPHKEKKGLNLYVGPIKASFLMRLLVVNVSGTSFMISSSPRSTA